MTKRLGAILIIICLLLIIGLYYLTNQNKNNGSIDNTNMTEKDAMVKLALSNNNFKWYLDNLSYNVTAVNSAQGYVLFELGNNTSYWESVMVGVDIATNMTDYVYLTDLQPKNLDEAAKMIKIALQDESVKGYINNKRYDIGEVNIAQNRVIIDIGPMTSEPGAVIVIVDQNKNKTTSVSYYPRTPLPQQNMTSN